MICGRKGARDGYFECLTLLELVLGGLSYNIEERDDFLPSHLSFSGGNVVCRPSWRCCFRHRLSLYTSGQPVRWCYMKYVSQRKSAVLYQLCHFSSERVHPANRPSGRDVVCRSPRRRGLCHRLSLYTSSGVVLVVLLCL